VGCSTHLSLRIKIAANVHLGPGLLTRRADNKIEVLVFEKTVATMPALFVKVGSGGFK
jgi:hypothetical protein